MLPARSDGVLAEGLDPGPTVTTRLAAGTDAVLDTVLVVLATWTVVYHLSLLLDLGSDLALVLEAVLLVGTAVARRQVRDRPVEQPSEPAAAPLPASGRPVRVATRVALAAAAVAAVSMALDTPWLLVWVSWLVAATAGLVAAGTTLTTRTVRTGPTVGPGSLEGWLVLAAAGVLAAFSMVTLRPNPDDLFYVNLSQWVAEHGAFPLRDTIYSNLQYPMTNWPPLASYDGLTGALAHVLGLRAGDIVYVVVPPLATALSVVALWRLLRAWRVRHVLVAMAFALLFLLVDGTSSYGPPGNLFLTRLWQGKVILLCLVVPLLLVHALRYVRRPSRVRAGWLFVGGAAAVACSTTAIFLVPLIALAGVAPLLVRRSWRQAAVGFAAMSAYPLAAAAVTMATGGRSADDFGSRRQYRFDPSWFGHAVFLTDLLAFVGVAAVLVGCLVLAVPAARVTTAVLVLGTGLTFVPGFTRLAYATVDLGPTLWRVTWGCTVAALVGALASYLWQRAPSPRTALLGGLVAALALGTFGAPIWRGDTTTSLHLPPHWQRSADALRLVDQMIGLVEGRADPGARVLAPDGLAISFTVRTTDVKTVTPRDYYLAPLRGEPGFAYDQRLLLTDFINDFPGRHQASGTGVASALGDLDVAVACVYADDVRGAHVLREAGYRPADHSADYRCLTNLNPT